MNHWIRRGGRLFGFSVFFLILITLVGRPDGLQINNLITACIYAFVGGLASWLIGTVISDIVLKGIITDIDNADEQTMLDGGLVQRLMMMQEKLVPGGEEMPFVEIKKAQGSKKKNR